MREMKDSGIGWVGNIPTDWKVISNRYLFKISKKIVENSNKYQLLSLTTKGIKEKNIEDTKGKVPDNYSGYQVVEKNDLVMCLFDLDCSAVFSGLSMYFGMISPAYKVLKVNRNISEEKFFDYWFQYVSSERFYKQYSKSLRYTISSDEFELLKSIVPPISEQQKIATFLDKKCGEIDAVCSDIQKQIEILEKYKSSIIAEAVTKGLNPHVEMKDSNVRYIGEIPIHWDIKKGKYIFNYLQKSIKEDDGVITCFRDGEVTLRSKRREDGFTISEKEIGYQGIDIGDLVVHGMDGFAGAIGISDSRGKASPVLNVLDTKQNKRYYMYLLRTMAFRGVFEALSTGIRVRTCDTNWGKLREIFYNVPLLLEQKEIADYLDKKCAEIESIIADKQSQLETIEKYKKSLIYEYVTGKKEVA